MRSRLIPIHFRPQLPLPLIAFLIALLLPAPSQAQTSADSSALDASAFAVYTSDGTTATLDDVLAAVDTVDVVFLGEQHDDPTAHALQDALFRRTLSHEGDSTATPRPVALSLEMFARDAQPVVDEYLGGWITEQHFRNAAQAWSNYADYRPLVEAAKAADRPVLAANAPRRYVNRVARAGAASLADLPASAHSWLPPLPYPMPSAAYQAKWMDLMRDAMPPGHGASADSSDAAPGASAHGSMPHGARHGAGAHDTIPPMLQAQGLWDATMGYTIAEHLMREPDALVIHLTGAFHMTRGTGTPETLRHYRPSARVLTVVLQPAADVAAFDTDAHAGLGDFVILTDETRIPERPSLPGME